MKILYAVVVAALSLGLTGCVVSEQKFVQYRAVIKTRPDLQAKMKASCVQYAARFSASEKEALAAMVDLRASNLGPSFCQRMMRSYLNGRLTYQDYKDLQHRKPTAHLIRLMRGQ